jgi:hypothetical protein
MSGREIAIEFTEIWRTLPIHQINKMLARNVPLDLLEFFSSYAQEFIEDLEEGAEGTIDEATLRRRAPNLLVIGYLIRLLEERIDDAD